MTVDARHAITCYHELELSILSITHTHSLSFFLFIALASEDEERLVRDLFRDYNKLIRPVKQINDTVTVEVKLSLTQLINVVSLIAN